MRLEATHGRPVDGTEVRADVEQYQVRLRLLGGAAGDGGEGGRHPEAADALVEGVAPRRAELLLGAGQAEIAGDEVEAGVDVHDMGVDDVALHFEQRRQRPVDGLASVGLPQRLDGIIGEERRRQVGLRVEVDDEDAGTELTEHPRHVIGERRLADPTLVVEEGDDRRHRSSSNRTSTAVGLTTNPGAGLPLAPMARRATSMPAPKR